MMTRRTPRTTTVATMIRQITTRGINDDSLLVALK